MRDAVKEMFDGGKRFVSNIFSNVIDPAENAMLLFARERETGTLNYPISLVYAFHARFVVVR